MMTQAKIQECIDLLNKDGINSKEQVKRILQEELSTLTYYGSQYNNIVIDEAKLKTSFSEDYKRFNEYLQQMIEVMTKNEVPKPYYLNINIELFNNLLRYDYDITSLKDYGFEYIIVNNTYFTTKYRIVGKGKLKVIEEARGIKC